ncbi:MAG TPA: glycosyltransferase [Steroidobacteraceae bacterium]|nr:glycosyltransferase [Steroidobacteraceae bacterium]
MRVSVIIPVFNGANRLADAVASVRPQLRDGDELIIVDDGSTDDTPDVIAGFGHGVTWMRQDNAGNAAARNAGLRRATGEAVAFLDHDDVWAPHRQAALLAALLANSGVGIVVGRVDVTVESRSTHSVLNGPRHATTHRPWHLDALLIRREVFELVGMFDESLRRAVDADWFMRVREAGVQFHQIDEVTVTYRLHESNISRDVASSRRDLLLTLKGAIDRRRSRL